MPAPSDVTAPPRARFWSTWRVVGLALITIAVSATLAHSVGGRLPSISWLYRIGETFAGEEGSEGRARALTGWILCGLIGALGIFHLVRGGRPQWNPQTIDRWHRFRSLRRGWWSFLILLFLIILALLDFTIVGSRALAVRHQGEWFFPAFREQIYTAQDFDSEGKAEADYRELAEDFARRDTGDLVIMPPVPWAPVLDTDDSQTAPIVNRDDGLYYRQGKDKPFSGLARGYHDADQQDQRVEYRFRSGLPDGPATGYNRQGENLFEATFDQGELTAINWLGDRQPDPGLAEQILADPIFTTLYAPLPPLIESRHFIGTDSRGWDLLAQMYGGWQVNLQAASIYLVITFSIGIFVGCLMGYLGGIFDLTVQRFIEILGNIPFLYVVIIITGVVGRENMTLMLLIGVICIFSWLGLTYYMRTATYREKARLYIDSARIAGASTPRIIGRHILPNVLAIIVTFVPFQVSFIIYSMTALSFLGFGLPDSYPAWGSVLNDGLAQLSSPWIVSSVFVSLVFVLLLITFVGEAVREAFDPKRFSTYR